MEIGYKIYRSRWGDILKSVRETTNNSTSTIWYVVYGETKIILERIIQNNIWK